LILLFSYLHSHFTRFLVFQPQWGASISGRYSMGSHPINVATSSTSTICDLQLQFGRMSPNKRWKGS
jgi:hypothetical protein